VFEDNSSPDIKVLFSNVDEAQPFELEYISTLPEKGKLKFIKTLELKKLDVMFEGSNKVVKLL